MDKKIILYYPNISSQDRINLRYLNIYNITYICDHFEDIVKNLSKETSLLIVSPEHKLSLNMLKDYFPQDMIPQIFDLTEIKRFRQKYGANGIDLKKSLLSIDSFLYTINIPVTSYLYSFLKYSLYIMAMFNIENFSYKILKLVSCLLGKNYEFEICKIRRNTHLYLKFRNSTFLNNLFSNKQDNRVHLLYIVDYCYKKYNSNQQLYLSQNQQKFYNISYYMERRLRLTNANDNIKLLLNPAYDI